MRRRYIIVIVLLFLLLFASPIGAQDDNDGGEVDGNPAGLTITAEAGFDGFYKSNQWVPIVVNIANDGAPIEGELRVRVGTGLDPLTYSAPVSLPTRSEKRIRFYVELPNVVGEEVVSLVDESGRQILSVETNQLVRLDNDTILYGVVSNEPASLDFLEDVRGDRADARVAYLTLDDLPNEAAAWNSLDAIVFTNVDTGRMNSDQLNALQSWTSLGGQLVVTGGSNWQATSSTLSDLLPVTITGDTSVDDLPALSAQMGTTFRDPGPYLVTTTSLTSGDVLVLDDSLALLTRRAHGRGHVYFLALSPNAAPLLDWSGNEALWSLVANGTPRLPVWGVGSQSSYSAAQALNSLPSLSLPSGLWLMLFLCAYIAVVGPINYLILRRMKRTELAWLTIPAIVTVFCMCSYVAGFGLRGNRTILNEMNIAFGHASEASDEQMRMRTLVGLYAPQRSTYDVIVPRDLLIRPFDRNDGSMSGSGSLDAISRGESVELLDVRVDVSGMETFVADSYAPMPNISGRSILRFEDGDAELDVLVQNNSDITLEDAGLLFGTTYISLGDIEPGDSETHMRVLSATSVSSAGASLSGSPVFVSPSSSPLGPHYDKILGTTDYYDDPVTHGRYQLLESLVPAFGTTGDQTVPRGIVTLIAWSEESYADIEVVGENVERLATTAYFIELPFTQTVATGSGIEVPLSLMSWRVLSESGGVYAPSIQDFYMPVGWVEFEYTPWSTFQQMDVTQLDLIMRHSGNETTIPQIRLWNWEDAFWENMDIVSWGEIPINNFERYVGENNTVRIRVQNDDTLGITIREIYPSLTGDLE